jgi:hypothetical protein
MLFEKTKNAMLFVQLVLPLRTIALVVMLAFTGRALRNVDARTDTFRKTRLAKVV